jgi:outer membrane protein OmpA-like peptidoglycan-associated protein
MGNDGRAARATPVFRTLARSAMALGGPLCLSGAMLLTAASAQAQQHPDTRQIIEALKPSPSRSLRNLVAREKPADPAVVADQPPASIDLTIEFDFNSSGIRAESRPLLVDLAMALKSPELRRSRFLIEGHTDAVGRPDHNLKLSLDRAEAVRRFLLATGVTSTQVDVAGRGSTQPANPADPDASENRRVRIVNLQ